MFRRAIPMILLSVLVFSMIPIAGAQEFTFDLAFDDPEGDTSKLNTTSLESEPIDGYEDVDVVHITSKEAEEGLFPIDTPGIDLPSLKDTIVFSLTVSGEIEEGNETYYVFIISADDELYQLFFSNGFCWLYGEDANEPCVSTIEENSTLNIFVDHDSIGDPSQSFNFSVVSARQISDDEMVMDLAPASGGGGDSQKTIEITGPTDGATVWDEVSVLGRTTGLQGNIERVEVIIEGSDDTWLLATSYDGWSTWRYDWDTTDVPDGTYTFRARAYDGEAHHQASIELWVYQEGKNGFPSVEMPKIPVGAKFIYKESTTLSTMGVSLSGTMEGEIVFHGNSTVEIEGETLPARTRTQVAEGDFMVTGIVPISTHITEEGRSWYQREDFAVIKSDFWGNTSLPEIGDVNGHTVTTYDPPMDRLRFPLRIGNEWTSYSHVTTESEVIDDESTQEDDIESYYEALHFETVTVEAGTFETFVIREEGGEMQSSDSFDIEVDYNLIYYSPELGHIVKEETFDSDGKTVRDWELVDHTVDLNATKPDGEGPNGTVTDGQGWELSFQELLLFFIAPLAILVLVMVAIRRRRKARKKETGTSKDISDSLSSFSQIRTGKAHIEIECPSCRAKQTVEFDGSDRTIKCHECGAEGTFDI